MAVSPPVPEMSGAVQEQAQARAMLVAAQERTMPEAVQEQARVQATRVVAQERTM